MNQLKDDLKIVREFLAKKAKSYNSTAMDEVLRLIDEVEYKKNKLSELQIESFLRVLVSPENLPESLDEFFEERREQ